MARITRNPDSINDTLDGRKAAYVAGGQSPAVYYWQPLASDPLPSASRNHRHFVGLRLDTAGQLTAVCSLPSGHWWESRIS